MSDHEPAPIRGVLSRRRSLAAKASDTDKTCTRVSISGDATYCITATGSVCGASRGACPQKDDVAVAGCLTSLLSYTPNTGCIAPVDAQCIIAASGDWECVFSDQEQSQDSSNSGNGNGSASAVAAVSEQLSPSPSPVPTPTTPIPTPAATTEGLDGMSLSTSGSNVSSTTSISTEDAYSTTAPNVTLNIAVAVAVCALAVVGIVLVKKKRKRLSLRTRQRESAILDSITSSPIM